MIYLWVLFTEAGPLHDSFAMHIDAASHFNEPFCSRDLLTLNILYIHIRVSFSQGGRLATQHLSIYNLYLCACERACMCWTQHRPLQVKALGCDGSTSLISWLDTLGLQAYLPNFLSAGYHTLDCVKNLWELEMINVSAA